MTKKKSPSKPKGLKAPQGAKKCCDVLCKPSAEKLAPAVKVSKSSKKPSTKKLPLAAKVEKSNKAPVVKEKVGFLGRLRALFGNLVNS